MRRLVSKGAIQSYQLPSNQKEIYYRLTPYGREIFKQHRLRHQDWEDRERMFFQSLNSDMLDMALQFMNIYNGYLEMKVAELSEQNSSVPIAPDEQAPLEESTDSGAG